jgi:hypothetical protein
LELAAGAAAIQVLDANMHFFTHGSEMERLIPLTRNGEKWGPPSGDRPLFDREIRGAV